MIEKFNVSIPMELIALLLWKKRFSPAASFPSAIIPDRSFRNNRNDGRTQIAVDKKGENLLNLTLNQRNNFNPVCFDISLGKAAYAAAEHDLHP